MEYFYMHTINPSETEIEHIGNNPILFKEYVREVMDQYAKNFQKEKIRGGQDLAYYAKIETARWIKTDEFGKKLPRRKWIKKEGLHLHAHVVVARKDLSNKVKLSPHANARGAFRTSNKIRSSGFNRNEMFKVAELSFDKMFSYERPYHETLEYYKDKNSKNEKVRDEAIRKGVESKLAHMKLPEAKVLLKEAKPYHVELIDEVVTLLEDKNPNEREGIVMELKEIIMEVQEESSFPLVEPINGDIELEESSHNISTQLELNGTPIEAHKEKGKPKEPIVELVNEQPVQEKFSPPDESDMVKPKKESDLELQQSEEGRFKIEKDNNQEPEQYDLHENFKEKPVEEVFKDIESIQSEEVLNLLDNTKDEELVEGIEHQQSQEASQLPMGESDVEMEVKEVEPLVITEIPIEEIETMTPEQTIKTIVDFFRNNKNPEQQVRTSGKVERLISKHKSEHAKFKGKKQGKGRSLGLGKIVRAIAYNPTPQNKDNGI